MKIEFNNTLYDILDTPNVHGTHFQATIKKDGVSLDKLLEDLKNTASITVYNDSDNDGSEDSIIGVYTGYTNLVAVSIIDGISVELENTDIESVIIDMQKKLTEVQQNNAVFKFEIPNVTALPKTLDDDRISKDMVVINKELSNPEATLTDFSAIVTDGSITIGGVVSDTTNIILYLSKVI